MKLLGKAVVERSCVPKGRGIDEKVDGVQAAAALLIFEAIVSGIRRQSQPQLDTV